MEAGAAAGPAGTAAPAGETDGQQQQGQQEQQAQQPDVGPLLQQLSDVPAQLEQMREWMESTAQQQQLAPGQEQQQEQQPGEVDLSFVDPNSPTYDPQQAASQLLTLLEQQNSQALQAQVAPLQQQLQDMQNAREADFLASEFPELQNPETADAVFKATAEWTAAIGHPELAGNMQVVRAVYMMGRAAELHNQEQGGEAGGQAATLEGAGGASPGGSDAGALTAESIIGNGRRSPLPF